MRRHHLTPRRRASSRILRGGSPRSRQSNHLQRRSESITAAISAEPGRATETNVANVLVLDVSAIRPFAGVTAAITHFTELANGRPIVILTTEGESREVINLISEVGAIAVAPSERDLLPTILRRLAEE